MSQLFGADDIKDGKRTWRLFMINISLIIVLFLSGIFLGFVMRTNRIIEEQMIATARSHFRNIVLTRRWNAAHSGVYVEKRSGVESNPYLENPDIRTEDGRVFTKKNPALMTREISEYARAAGDFVYHITSLNPLNPGNRPDEFERQALMKFEDGLPEVTGVDNTEGGTVFRYMAPLYVEEGCLSCHAKQVYKTGQVRGGISVTFDISDIRRQMKTNKIIIAAASIVTVSVLIIIFYFMVNRLAKKLAAAQETIARMAVTDELTRLYNRRYFHVSLDREISRSRRYARPISLLMMDIDHFKQVNDNFGHLVGDEVIAGVAGVLRQVTRVTDIAARYGGEEFAVILPETDRNKAFDCARKLRKKIEAKTFMVPDGRTIQVTVSVGVASLPANETAVDADHADTLVNSADKALYEAKEDGRNRVAGA